MGVRRPSLAGPAGDQRRSRRRLLVVSPRAHLQSLPEVFAALLDSGTELIFCGQGVKKIQRAVDRLAHPLASAVALPLRRKSADADVVTCFRALSDLVFLLHPEFREARWSRRRAAYRFLKASGH